MDRPAPTCPYCGQPALFLASSEQLYGGRDFGPAWACLPCEAWVGCHRNSRTHAPLGRLADRRLRLAKMHAHQSLDRLWRRKMEREQCRKSEARRAAYKWLSGQMGIAARDCHIGMFDVAQCRQVVQLCAPYLRREHGND